MPSSRRLEIRSLGVVPYPQALALQQRLVEARAQGQVSDQLLLLEHPRVVTLGRRAKEAHLRLPCTELVARGYAVEETNRGGDVTYHGPGQIVGYPIVDLKPDRCDVRQYMRDLEEVMIRVAGVYGLPAERIEGLTGAWSQGRKFGALGVRISRWVTMHGFALNVQPDLADYEAIVPCGIADRSVTSLASELGRALPMPEVERHLALTFSEIFDANPVWMTQFANR